MSAAVTTPRITVEEFLQRPERMDGWQEELIDGEIILLPNPNKLHTDTAGSIFELLLPLKQRGFVVKGEVACRLSPESLPNTDAAVIRRERWDAVAPNDFLRESPALAIEVHSPANTKPKLLRKVELYLEHGAKQCWMLYPKQRKVVVYFPDSTSEEAGESQNILFYGCVIQVRDLFE